jgi:hypothetical protein
LPRLALRRADGVGVNLLVVLAAWSVLSVPAALALGAVLGAPGWRSEAQVATVPVSAATPAHRSGS